MQPELRVVPLVVATLAFAVVLERPAVADGGERALVLPVEVGAAGDEIAQVAMTGALEQGVRDTGRAATVSSESRASIAAIAGCPGALSACVTEISNALGVTEVVYGDAEKFDGGYRVHLVYLAVGKDPVERDVVIEAPLAEEAGLALRPRVVELLSGSPAVPAVVPAAGPELVERRPIAFSLDRVGALSWGGLAAGAALIATGTVVGVIGESKQDDIDSAAIDTVADLEALEELESEAQTLTQVGNVLLISGGVVAAAGLGWGLYQALTAEQPAAVAVMPMTASDTVGVVVTMRGWSW